MPKANYNPIKITYPDGAGVSTTYDPVFANPLNRIDESGVLSTYEYDPRGNLIKMTEAKGVDAHRILTTRGCGLTLLCTCRNRPIAAIAVSIPIPPRRMGCSPTQ